MLSLAWPWVFVLLPLPWLCYRLLPAALVQHSALQAPFFHQLQQLSTAAGQQAASNRLRLFLLLIIWLALLVAAARPQQTFVQPPKPEQGQSFMLVIDLSNSMNITDADPHQPDFSRLDLVKQLTLDLVRRRPDDRFGLIFFAHTAYLQSPLTHDQHSLAHWLQTARAGMIGARTAIGDAIGLAIKLLRPAPNNKKTIFLITDGANNSGSIPPVTAASFAAGLGLKIHSIGIGSQSRASGHELDEQLLQQLSAQTGGQYLHINSRQQLPQVLELINRLEPVESAGTTLYQNELYHYPLLLTLLFAVLLALYNMPGYLRQHPAGGQHD